VLHSRRFGQRASISLTSARASSTAFSAISSPSRLSGASCSASAGIRLLSLVTDIARSPRPSRRGFGLNPLPAGGTMNGSHGIQVH
jgi:hypothetical protein